MTRVNHDCAWATAKAILDMVGHLLREEERREFFGLVVTEVEACLVKRDELLKRERARLGRSHETDS